MLDIVSTMAWGLGYFGMPHILLRFMAIEDEKKLVLSRRIATVWVVIAMAASIVIGMVGLGMTRAGALEFLSGSSSETLIVRIASLISQHGVLAAVLAGLILAGILAATMSTADSQMLAAASSVSQNILQEFGHLKLNEKQSLFAARLTIICVSVVGVVLARDPDILAIFTELDKAIGVVPNLIKAGLNPTSVEFMDNGFVRSASDYC